mgnify:CR=1 FL=1
MQPPVGITSVRIDLKTGLLTQATDNSSGFEFFIQGTEPKTYTNSSVQQLPTQNNQQQQEEIELFWRLIPAKKQAAFAAFFVTNKYCIPIGIKVWRRSLLSQPTCRQPLNLRFALQSGLVKQVAL